MLCNSIGYFNNLTHEMKIANPTAIVLQRNRRFSIYMSQLSFNSIDVFLQGKLFCETNKCIN